MNLPAPPRELSQRPCRYSERRSSYGPGGWAAIAEEGVIPDEGRGFDPLRLLVLVGVFDQDAEAGVADQVGGLAEDPVAGLFISTMAQMRSPAPRKRVSTSAELGTGLPSRAMTWNLWPPREMRRFSMGWR